MPVGIFVLIEGKEKKIKIKVMAIVAVVVVVVVMIMVVTVIRRAIKNIPIIIIEKIGKPNIKKNQTIPRK